MPTPEQVLAVPFHKQEKDYYCGPATIQMILDYRHVSGLVQDDLWAEVQDNSTCHTAHQPLTPAEPAEPAGPVADYLWVKKRKCPCWDTSPEASAATINSHAPRTVHATYVHTAPQGIDQLLASIDHDVPPAATISGVNHWVVIYGYLLDPTPEPNGQDPPPYTIKGLYVMDPLQTDETVRQQLVPLDEWTAKFGLMSCGPKKDQYPIVVAP